MAVAPPGSRFGWFRMVLLQLAVAVLMLTVVYPYGRGDSSRPVPPRPAQGHGPLTERTIPAPAGLRGVAFNADGGAIATSGDDEVWLWSRTTGQLMASADLDRCGGGALAYQPGRDLLAVGCQDGRLWTWDLGSGEAARPMSDRHSGGRITDVEFSRDGRLLATAGADGWVVLWDMTTRKRSRLPLDVESFAPGTRQSLGVLSVAFHPDGTTLAIASASQVSLLDVESRSVRGFVATGARAVSVAYSPDGGSFAVGQDDRTVSRWSVAGLRPSGPPMIGADSYVYRLAYSADGSYLVAGSHTGVTAWDTRTGRSMGPALVGGAGFALSPDGQMIATYRPNSSDLLLWSTRRWAPRR